MQLKYKMEMGMSDLELSEEANTFDKEWDDNHIPTKQRLKNINGKYIIEECPHCIQFYIMLYRQFPNAK